MGSGESPDCIDIASGCGVSVLRIECEVACELCPDVVEWCCAPSWSNYLAYGTYELNEATSVRNGAIQIAYLEHGDANEGVALKSLDSFPCAGVYDVAWGPPVSSTADSAYDCNGPLLAVARADGSMQLCCIGQQINSVASLSLVDESILTHVTWVASDATCLAAVGQNGHAHVVKICDDGTLEILMQWEAHALETWCVEASTSNPHLIITGADDGFMRGWDVREPPDATPIFTNRRSHQAGVTALAFDPLNEQQFASGSYDERVRVFDLRDAARTPIIESAQLGDGAYHLAWHPRWAGILAVAGMRSGLPLLQVDASPENPQLHECTRYAANASEGQHGSLAYGVSWQSTSASDGLWFAASASFYDKSVHVWSVQNAVGEKDGLGQPVQVG